MSSDARPSSDIPGHPPTPTELGNSGWNILHSAAAVYPYKPSPAQADAMRHFLYSGSYVYACNWCAYHMRSYLKDHPPDVTDKLTVSRFVCEFHNEVNRNLGKDEVDCDPDTLLRRWHPGYPHKMHDTPSMEERVAAEQRRQDEAAQQRQARAAEAERRLSDFGTPSEAPRDGEAWRSWQRTVPRRTVPYAYVRT